MELVLAENVIFKEENIKLRETRCWIWKKGERVQMSKFMDLKILQ